MFEQNTYRLDKYTLMVEVNERLAKMMACGNQPYAIAGDQVGKCQN